MEEFLRKTTTSPVVTAAEGLGPQLFRLFGLSLAGLTIGGLGRTAYLFIQDLRIEKPQYDEFLKASKRVDLHGNPIPE